MLTLSILIDINIIYEYTWLNMILMKNVIEKNGIIVDQLVLYRGNDTIK